MSLPAGEQHATKEIQEICDQVKTTVEKMISRNLTKFEAIIYRKEMATATFTRYQVKVCVRGDEYFHVLILCTVSETGEVKTTVETVEQNHTKDDIIVPVN